MKDIIIIGAGVIGSFIAKECSAYDVNITVLESESDVACGTSKANSGIVHGGYDAKPGTFKAKLNVEGCNMMPQVTEDLKVPYKQTGSLVLAFNEEDLLKLQILYEQGLQNGVTGLKIIEQKEVREIEPGISREVIGALYCGTAGIVSPYELTVGAMEVAIRNGVELKLEESVTNIEVKDDGYIVYTKKNKYPCHIVINAAGVFTDDIARMIGDESITITPRKGEYILLDRNQGPLVNHVLFQPPTKVGKGILVTPTVHGNLLIGPNAKVTHKDDVDTSDEGQDAVLIGAKRSISHFDEKEIIRSFAGLRATGNTGDFIIRKADNHPDFIHVAGIESPGLSAAPAIGVYVREIIQDQLGSLLDKIVTTRRMEKPFNEMSEAERKAKIKENPAYGNIICRCEMITEGEIIDCINRPGGARTVDAVKRRTRAGMGRCQGGFCTPRTTEILARELEIPLDEVTLKGRDSYLLVGKTK